MEDLSGDREVDFLEDFFLGVGDLDFERDFDFLLRLRGDRDVDFEGDRLLRRRLSLDRLLLLRLGDRDFDFERDLDFLRDLPVLLDRLRRMGLLLGDLLLGDLLREELRDLLRRGDLVRDRLLR